ncbi:hypothetical protein FACS1894193_13900 [Bacilli bacterium]|uniref:Uncharacterized protein n=1 Tax=Pseudolactococcus reticulitermitis TaxID=2025039 RepID=A0A224XEZ9_9LACT|nr:hypothetical protein RsY01_2101 [Lactococcus reticulitermitis]GHU38856.1 hypothetical protein FACS1894192_11430 [Bacilli bacterium]GHU45055.1 hypothetical protein FACS1894193_13900 [Bacilli bacterium]GHU46475.1 hypothetical protein FACS1894194_4190 [Bacilli bacterium]
MKHRPTLTDKLNNHYRKPFRDGVNAIGDGINKIGKVVSNPLKSLKGAFGW